MATDPEFLMYVQQKQNSYDEGNTLQPNQLMELVLNKYKILVEAGTWNKADDTKDRVFALEACTNAMAKQIKGGNGKKPRSPPTAPKSAKKQAGTNNKKGKSGEGWKKVQPKDGESKHKQVDDKDFYWCTKHKAWTRHKPEECKGIDFKAKVKTAMAHAATIDNSDEYDSSP
jgi:hypothetical protein